MTVKIKPKIGPEFRSSCLIAQIKDLTVSNTLTSSLTPSLTPRPCVKPYTRKNSETFTLLNYCKILSK